MKKDRLQTELRAIQKKSRDGVLHAREVLAWAETHKQSALHSRFEWDNTKAAAEHRLWQAREIIRLVIVNEDREPQFVSLSCDRSSGGGYREISNVVKSEHFSAVMLRDAIQELNRVRTRYNRVKQLTSVWRELDKVITALQKEAKTTRRKAA